MAAASQNILSRSCHDMPSLGGYLEDTEHDLDVLDAGSSPMSDSLLYETLIAKLDRYNKDGACYPMKTLFALFDLMPPERRDIHRDLIDKLKDLARRWRARTQQKRQQRGGFGKGGGDDQDFRGGGGKGGGPGGPNNPNDAPRRKCDHCQPRRQRRRGSDSHHRVCRLFSCCRTARTHRVQPFGHGVAL